MEELLRFDGDLNLAQGNLPEGDYSDANNIVMREDENGNAGAVKKLRDIGLYKELQQDILASCIKPNGDQFFLVERDSVPLFRVDIDSSNFPVGTVISQSNGFIGIIYRRSTRLNGDTRAFVFSYSTQNFNSGLSIYKSIDGSGSSFSISNYRNPVGTGDNGDYASIVKVSSSGTISFVMGYVLSSQPTIEDPTMRIIGDSIVWNYLSDGTPLVWDTTRTYALITGTETSPSIDDIELIKRPPYGVELTENTSSGPDSFFDENTITFAARYVFDSGEYSVLSPYSTFIANPDRSDLNFGLDGVESIDLKVRGSFSFHPYYATSIEFYAKVNNGQFRRVESIDISSQTQNVSVNFSGQLSETISTDEATRSFDVVPLKAEALDIIQNRIFLGNITEDLANEAASASIVVSTSQSFTTGSNNNSNNPYWYVKGDNTVRDSVSNQSNAITDRGMLSNESKYKLGVAFYDENLRTRGVIKSSISDVQTGLFESPLQITSLTLTASQVPSWAKYYKVLSTRNLSKDFSIEGYANGIFYQLEDGDGALYFSNVAPDGIKINAVVIDADLSYTFQSGDKVNIYNQSTGGVISLTVKAVINGRIHCNAGNIDGYPYLTTQRKYFEIYSPKDISNEDDTLFYETEIVGDVSDFDGGASKVFSFPKIYDQTLIKEKVSKPVYEKCVDSERQYHFDGDSSPRVQDGLPVGITGGLIYMSSDLSKSFSNGTISTPVVNAMNFDSLHTNDPAGVDRRVYQIEETSHGHTEGDILTSYSVGSGAVNGIVLRVIDSNTYIVSQQTLTLFVGDSSDFSAGDVVTVETEGGDISATCITAPTGNISVSGISLSDSMESDSYFISVTNGVTSQNISSVSLSFNDDDGFERTMFSEDKIYAGRYENNFITSGKTEIYGGQYPINESTAFNTNPFQTTEVRFDYQQGLSIGFRTIVFPAKSGSGKLFYGLDLQNDASVSADVFIVAPIGMDDINIGTIAAGERSYISGSVDIELDRNRCTDYAVCLRETADETDSPAHTIYKGSYLYGELEEDLSKNIISYKSEDAFTVSRKPNRRIDDDFTFDLLQGKPLTVDRGINARDLETKIRFGGKYIEDSLFNPISSFDARDASFVPEESGGITQLVRTNKIDSVGTVLLALCEREVNSIYVGERLITNNDGSTSLAVSDSVIGSIQPLRGSRGTRHRSSIAKDQGGNVVFWDEFNRDICRYSREGVVPISDIKVKPFFENKTGKFISFYDKFYNMFFFHHPGTGKTISYDQDLRWVGFHDFSLTLGGNQADERSFPISGTKIYKTREGSNYGTYFGSTATSYIQLSLFSNQNIEPRFLRLRGDLSDLSSYTVKNLDVLFTNDMGQQTSLDQDFFEIEGSYIFSDIYFDENNGGIRGGIPLLGSKLNAKITLNSDTEDAHPLREAYLGFSTATY